MFIWDTIAHYNNGQGFLPDISCW